MIVVKPVTLSKKSIITISWPYDADAQTLKNPQCSTRKLQQSIVLLSLVQFLDYKINGSLNDTLKSKFAQVEITSHDGHSILTLTTEPNFSAVRKVLSLVSKYFQVSKCLAVIKRHTLGKLNLQEVHWCMDELSKGLQKADVFITGSIRVPQGHKFEIDFVKESFTDKKEPPKDNDKDLPQGYKCKSALEAFMLQLLFKSFMVESSVRDYTVVPIVKTKVEKYEKFAEKLCKLGDKLGDVLLLEAASSGLFTAQDLNKCKKMTEKEIIHLYEKIEK